MDVTAPGDPVPGYLNAAAVGLPPRVVTSVTGNGGRLADMVRQAMDLAPNGRPVLAPPDPDGHRAGALGR